MRPLCFNECYLKSCLTSISTNAISLNTNRKDNFTKHNKAAHQSRRYGSWCWLINSGGSCRDRPHPLRSKRWAAVLTMSCCCLAANDKATAQKQMTENQRGVCSSTAKHSRVMAEPAADTLEPAAAVYSNNQTCIYIRLQQLMGKYKGNNVWGKKAKVISIWWTEPSRPQILSSLKLHVRQSSCRAS